MTAIVLGSKKAVMAAFRESHSSQLAAGIEIVDNAMQGAETEVISAWAKEKDPKKGQKERAFGKNAANIEK